MSVRYRLVALALVGCMSPAFAADRPERRVLRSSELEGTPDAAAAEVTAARAESIERLAALLRAGVGEGDTRAEMVMRLAELRVEAARELHAAEMEAHLAAMDACAERPGCDPTALSPDHRASGAELDRAIGLYRRLVTDAPDFARADEATYFLAQALLVRAEAARDEASRDEAARELTRLVRTWPQSAVASDAFLLLGEHHFERGEALRALPAYQRAAADTGYPQRHFARYKLAWCQYNLGEYGAAFASLREVILAPATAAREVTLRDEALRDLVRFAADGGLEEEAGELLAGIGRRDLQRGLMVQLGDLYLEQGRWEASAVIFRRVLTEAPDAPDAPALSARVVAALQKRGDTRGAVEELLRMRRQYGPSSAWARANAADSDARAAAARTLEVELRRAATALHASRSARRAELELAEHLYAAWLEDFPGAPEAVELRYAHAELLYKLKRFEAAYAEYMAVVAADPRGRRAEFCASSAIFAAQELAVAARAAKGAEPGVGLLPAERQLLAAVDQYVQLFPSDAQKVQALYYKAGYLHQQAGDPKTAAERFRTVIAMNPGTRDAEQAAELILDGLAVARDWDTLRSTALDFSTRAGLGTPAFRADARVVAGQATLQGIEDELLRSGDKLAAIAALRRFDTEFPDSPQAPVALHNRAVYAEQLGLYAEVVAAREALVARHPGSAQAQASPAALGFAYESLARFEEAAGWYERLATRDDPAAADALYSAALFRAALGQPARALEDYERLVARWPERPDAVGVRIEIAELLERQGAADAAARAWLLVVERGTADERMVARLRHGRLLGGDRARQAAWWRESVAEHERMRARGEGGAVAADAAAEMRLLLLEPEFQAALARSMPGPGPGRVSARQAEARLQQQFAEKVRAVQALDRAYTEVIGTGSSRWAVESLVRLGALSEDLSAKILDSWVPEQLTDDQREIYRMRLEDLAWAPRQRAAEFYAAAVDRSAAFTLRTEAGAAAAARLAALRPDAPPPAPERLPAPAYLASASSSRSWERE